MDKMKFNKGQYLYDIAISSEIYPDNPDDISLHILNMLAEIQELGYDEFQHLADIELRKIKDSAIMKILFKYYREMDLFTRDSIIYKIDPRKIPDILQVAKEEFLKLSPSDKFILNGFQITMSKGTFDNEYTNSMLNLLKIGDNYFALSEVRKKLCKKVPLKMIQLLNGYEESVLLVEVIRDYNYLLFSNEVTQKLHQLINITTNEIDSIISSSNNRNLSVTTYEYYKKICSVDRIRKEAYKLLNKSQKNQ